MDRQPSPHEQEIDDQPRALRAFAGSPLPAELTGIRLERHDRIILTGMGASHYAALAAWQALVARGWPAWWLPTAQLLDSPDLIAASSLLIVTSQSGLSGEVVRLTEWLAAHRKSARLIAITNDLDSPLARRAGSALALRAGSERSVSNKSYLNSLAAHDRLCAALLGRSDSEQTELIEAAAGRLEGFGCASESARLVRATLAGGSPAFGHLVGRGVDLATVLWGGLILKEGAKVPAEGHDIREFRHGPQEVAAPGMFLVMFLPTASSGPGPPRDWGRRMAGLGCALLCAGNVGPGAGRGAAPGSGRAAGRGDLPAVRVGLPDGPPLLRRVLGARLLQQIAVDFAVARGLEPGSIRVGDKVTTSS